MGLFGRIFGKSESDDDTPAPILGTGEGDSGPTELGLTHDKGKVVIVFKSPKRWVAFDPVGARNLSDALRAEADFLQGVRGREEAIKYAANRMRDMLITRVTLMLISMEQDKRKPSYQAAHIVDQCLQGISELASR